MPPPLTEKIHEVEFETFPKVAYCSNIFDISLFNFKGMQNSPFFTKVYGSCVQNAVPLEWEPLSAFCMSDGTWRSIFDDVGSIFQGGCQCMAGYEVHAYTSHLIAKQCFSFFPSLTA